MKTNKGLPKWVKIVSSIIIVLALVCLAGYLIINAKLNKINTFNEVESIPPESEYFETETESEDTTQPEVDYSTITWPDDDTVLKDQDVINILLIGQDAREGQSRQRSDSMMIATINKKTNTIKITSLMRDMYVQIPGYSDNRINAAYAFGGMELLDATIEKNFLVSVDGNVEVDFSGFKTIIDTLDGIDISINAEEASYLNASGYSVSEGSVHMDGAMALEYSRIRYVGHADYERTERQRRVITTVFAKIKDSGLTEILGLVDELFPLITTDLSNGELIGLATTMVMMDAGEIQTNRLPQDNTYTSTMIRGMSVLVPDLSSNREALKSFIYE